VRKPRSVIPVDDPVLVEKFWGKVRVRSAEECWECGNVQTGSYPYLYHRGDLILMSRLSFTLHFGQVPDGLLVCHRCDNTRCVNPFHLFAGTQAENMADCIAKGRNPTKAHPRPVYDSRAASRAPAVDGAL
jgi:hypothetical protein